MEDHLSSGGSAPKVSLPPPLDGNWVRVVLVVGAWHVEAEATVPAVHGVEEGVEVCGLPVFVDAQGGEGVAQSADVMVSHQPGQVLAEVGCEFLQPQGFSTIDCHS